MLKHILILMAVLPLTACAVPIPANEMRANPKIYSHLEKGKLTKAVAVGDVSIGPKAPTAGLVVTPEQFSIALQNSLAAANWSANKGAEKYRLDANFVGFDQPFTVFNTKVFSEFNYTLRNQKSDSVLYQQNVKIPCVIGMGEIWDGNVRQIETMKCSIRENVTHLLRDLNSKF